MSVTGTPEGVTIRELDAPTRLIDVLVLSLLSVVGAWRRYPDTFWTYDCVGLRNAPDR